MKLQALFMTMNRANELYTEQITVHCTAPVSPYQLWQHVMPCIILAAFPSWSLCAIPLYTALPHVQLWVSQRQEGQIHVGVSPVESHQGGLGAKASGVCGSWACLAWKRKSLQGEIHLMFSEPTSFLVLLFFFF